MITVEKAIDYATDQGVRISDDFMVKGTGHKSFYVSDGTYYTVQVTQDAPRSRAWRVEGHPGRFTRSAAILQGIEDIKKLLATPEKDD